MRKKIASYIFFIGYCFQALSRKIYISDHEKMVQKWFKNDGNNNEWIYHDLDADSIVFDVGGFKGRFASDIYTIYQCKQIHVFEPIKKYATELKTRFKKNKHIYVYPFGLSNKDSTQYISLNNDGSSVYLKGKESEQIKLIRLSSFLTKKNFNHVDLLKLNVEGSEYDILEDLIKTGEISIFKNIQVQFHDFAPNAFIRIKQIQKQLRKTHRLTYQYNFVWENWRKI